MADAPINIDAYLSIFTKHKVLFFIIAFTIMTLGVFYTYVVPKKYEASSTVFIEKTVINELVKGIAITPATDASIQALTTAMSSRNLILKAVADVDFNLKSMNDAAIENLIAEIQKNTEIRMADKDIFRVKFRHTDPKIARDYVNSLVRHYIENEVSSKRTGSYDATNFLEQQISSYKEKVVQKESEVSKYKNEKSSVVNVDSGQVFKEINLAQQRLFELQLRRKQLEEEKGYVKNLSDPIRQKLRVLERRLEELRVQYTDNFPEVMSVKSQIETLEKETIIQRVPGSPVTDTPPDIWKIEAELKAIKDNEASVQRNMAENRRLLNSIPESRYALEKLEAAKNTEKNMQDLLAMRNNQAELSKQMELQDKGVSYKIIDPAVTPVTPVSPNRRKLLLMSISAGLAGAAGVLFLIDQLDTSVKLIDNLKPLGLPILAVIPLIKSEEEICSARERDLKIYAVSSMYFSLILMVVVLELISSSIFETAVYRMHLPQIFARFFK